jgi:hypothetical protein
MWTWIYHLLNAVLLVSVLGFGIYVFKETKDWPLKRRTTAQTEATIHTPSALLFHVLVLVEHYFPLVVCLLWSAAIVYGLVNWATTTWSSQGRLVFSAISTLTTLLVVGLVGWLPRRPAAWIIGGLAVFLLLVAAVAPFVWIRPAYEPPERAAALANRTRVDFSNKMRLVGYEIENKGQRAVRPGEAVWVWLEWEVLAPMVRDWSVFVHLNDPVLGRPIAQRDMFPGQGLLATRLLQPGQRLVNAYRLQVPATTVAPTDLEVVVGLYDFYTGERLTAAAPADVQQDAVTLAVLPLVAVPGDYPNPISVNFGHEVTLVGYDLGPRRAQPGGTVELTTYWRVQRPLAENYTFFVQVVAEDTTRWASQDVAPAEGTSTWPAGSVQPLTMPLSLAAETPADVYPMIIGLYTRTADGGFDRLQVITEDGRPTDDFLQLTLLRVDE